MMTDRLGVNVSAPNQVGIRGSDRLAGVRLRRSARGRCTHEYIPSPHVRSVCGRAGSGPRSKLPAGGLTNSGRKQPRASRYILFAMAELDSPFTNANDEFLVPTN